MSPLQKNPFLEQLLLDFPCWETETPSPHTQPSRGHIHKPVGATQGDYQVPWTTSGNVLAVLSLLVGGTISIQ
jgi:hypothetical protein